MQRPSSLPPDDELTLLEDPERLAPDQGPETASASRRVDERRATMTKPHATEVGRGLPHAIRALRNRSRRSL